MSAVVPSSGFKQIAPSLGRRRKLSVSPHAGICGAGLLLLAASPLAAQVNGVDIARVAVTAGAVSVQLTCPCDADFNNDGQVTISDIACVNGCVNNGQCLCCQSSCDVNCDGDLSQADVDATQCMFAGNPPNLCCPKTGGACCMPGGLCQLMPPGVCADNDGTPVSHCPPDFRCVPPGDDCFVTDCGRTSFDFCDDPLPADFFGPGSEPFEGRILLGGPMDGLPDTTVRRFEPMLLDGPPETVPIELVQLHLTSCAPIAVSFEGFETLWDVAVFRSPFPVPAGMMEVTRTHANGGTFESSFPVLPLFVFTEIGNPTNQKFLDFGAEGMPPAIFETTGTSNWVSTANVPTQGCGVNFVPGVSENPDTLEQCCTETCHDNPGGGHQHCTKQCSVCPRGACCLGIGGCVVTEGPGPCLGQYKGDGTNCEDSDGDGLADVMEDNDCCLLSSACSASSSPNNSDTDGDGVLDGDEIAQGCDPCVPNDCGTSCCGPIGDCITNIQPADCMLQGGTVVPFCSGPRCVPPGNDCWSTECGRTSFDFCNDPIPAGFFDPGSEPFTGLVRLGGTLDGLPDTIVRRHDAMVLNVPGETATVPIELLQLSLVSCQPITVVINGLDTFWDVTVGMSPNLPPLGQMTVSQAHANGGTFGSELLVWPRFVFTQVGNPGNQRILDASQPMDLDTLGYTGPGSSQKADFVFSSFLTTACGVNFVPGVEEDPGTLQQCCTETCHANPGGGHEHCTKQCNVCPTGACCAFGPTCTVVNGAINCPGEYKGDGTHCDDSDGDGIADWLEINDCCQPSVICSAASDPGDADTDDDGMLDGEEISQGCDPCVPYDCIPPGNDCFTTSCGDTLYDFCNDPIPNDFFDPGSLPFEGTVYFQGANGPSSADTVMRRMGMLSLPTNGSVQTVPIELVALNLVSCDPIVVQNSVGPDSLWNVEVGLSPTPAPPGAMTVTREHARGGTFTSSFSVQPLFIFRRVGNPGDIRVLDTAGNPAALLNGIGSSPWTSNPTVLVSPLCDPAFAPGVDSNPASLAACVSAQECCVQVGHAGPGHLHVTGETCTPCPCGACCMPNGTCDQFEGTDPAGDCADAGGSYLGDGTSCADSDGDGIADWFEKSNCCDEVDEICAVRTDPTNPDTDGDGVSDGQEITDGTDPCLQEGFEAPTPEPSPIQKVRFISFVVPTIPTGTDTGLRVELTSLHHPVPAPSGTPDFSAHEGSFRYVNSFGGATTCVDSATFLTNYRCGQLGCQPEYRDWATALSSATNPAAVAGLIHVTGESVVPSSILRVSRIAASCGAAPGANSCAMASASLAVSTARWGDVGGSGGGGPDGTANVIDIGLVVDNVKGLPTALPEYRAWMKNPTNPFGNPVNVIDIGLIVDAVKGFPYPYGITACP